MARVEIHAVLTLFKGGAGRCHICRAFIYSGCMTSRGLCVCDDCVKKAEECLCAMRTKIGEARKKRKEQGDADRS